MMSSKGISPLIASVLLIAFTVSVAMIVMGWFSGFVRTTTENVSGVSQQAVGCSTGVVSIDKIYVNNASTTARLVIKNEGGVALTVSAMIVNNAGTTCANNTGMSLAAGSIGTLNISGCPTMGPANFSKAIVTTSCSGISDTTSDYNDVSFS